MTKRMEKWTPGPWEAKGCTVWEAARPCQRIQVIANTLAGREEDEANARLIAHAPEMAEALKSVLAATDALLAAAKVAKRILAEMQGENTQEVNHG